MSTYLDLQNRIASDLTRPDLASQTKSAISDAVKNYETSRFWFNTTRSLSFPTVVGQSVYTGSDLAQIPNIIRIDTLYISDGVSIYPLTRNEPDAFEMISGNPLNAPGKPTDFAYIDGTVIVWPVPIAVYALRPHMHYRLAPLVADTDTNAWCNEAEMLIRTHAKMLLYANVLEDTANASVMQAQIQPLVDRLNYETSARSSTGRIHATDF